MAKGGPRFTSDVFCCIYLSSHTSNQPSCKFMEMELGIVYSIEICSEHVQCSHIAAAEHQAHNRHALKGTADFLKTLTKKQPAHELLLQVVYFMC